MENFTDKLKNAVEGGKEGKGKAGKELMEEVKNAVQVANVARGPAFEAMIAKTFKSGKAAEENIQTFRNKEDK